ncbi:MAG: UDP-N-acetylmuramyl-tripeptide synthetase, partial [Candidatus Gracilibacteria bacterium]|nr:UDP-N-acetylmuramyl-tripeptide synthetase [Candidatus Gracilibacteria bacterium]
IINVDDDYGQRLAEELADEKTRVVTFGGVDPGAKWRISQEELFVGGAKFRLEGRREAFDVASNLIGEHNIHNLAGAILAVRAFGLKPEEINQALATEIRVPGRLERINSKRGFPIYVDYAHSDDALRRALETLKKITEKRVIAVFGAGGNRDRTKRPRMGRAAAELADYIILTSDNPRDEDPTTIVNEIAAGIPEGTPCEVELNRHRAIRHAIETAEEGDAILIAGKGHETYQEIRGVRHPFSDRNVVKTILANLRKAK